MNMIFAILLIAFIILLGSYWTVLLLHHIIGTGWSNLLITEQTAHVLGIATIWVLAALVISLIIKGYLD